MASRQMRSTKRPSRRRQEAPEAQTSAAARYFLGGWGFDWLYRYAFEVPFLWFARVSRDDLFEPPSTASRGSRGLAGEP